MLGTNPMWAILSDLHANLEALDAVLGDAAAQGVREDHIACLGDLVGYGPDPVAVVDRARRWPCVIRGNHDEGLIGEHAADFFGKHSREALLWTRELLLPRPESDAEIHARWRFLESLPPSAQLDGALLVHGSPRYPVCEYLLAHDGRFAGDAEVLRSNFALVERLCFVSHSHVPGVFTPDGRHRRPDELGNRFEIEPGAQAIVNVGAVGQPRDDDPRACYVLFDGGVVRFRRVEYPVAVTQGKIRRNPRLAEIFAERLSIGR